MSMSRISGMLLQRMT
ncbi:hypothetical protein LINGRAHAP2_LOCUS4439 [Linum grandiflorum]